jgi:hypothetical protein
MAEAISESAAEEGRLARFDFEDVQQLANWALRPGQLLTDIAVLEALFPEGSTLFTSTEVWYSDYDIRLEWTVVVATRELLSKEVWNELRGRIGHKLGMTDCAEARYALVVISGEEVFSLKKWREERKLVEGSTMGNLDNLMEMFP